MSVFTIEDEDMHEPSNMAMAMVPLTDDDIHQIESFFRSRRTQVYVCPGLVNLYFGGAESFSNLTGWELHTTGIPTLLWDPNNYDVSKSHLRICIAERGTGFTLWQDRVDQLSNYTAPDKAFHTMRLARDRKTLAGLSFDDERAAADLLRTIRSMVSEMDPNMPKGKKAKKMKRRMPKPPKPPRKTDISLPCCFEHITKLEKSDRDHIVTLQTLVPDGKPKEKEYRTFRR